jgi:hypothetical protein
MEGKGILAVFLVPIVCIILLGIIWSTVQTATVPSTVTNESFAAVKNAYVALDNDELVAVSAIRNATVLIGAGNYSVDLAGGRINSTLPSETYYADYTYKGDSYMESSISRTITGYLPVIFAVVVLVFIAGFVVLKKRAE